MLVVPILAGIGLFISGVAFGWVLHEHQAIGRAMAEEPGTTIVEPHELPDVESA